MHSSGRGLPARGETPVPNTEALRGGVQVLAFRIKTVLYPKQLAEYAEWGIFTIEIEHTRRLSSGQLVRDPSTFGKLKGSLPPGVAPYIRYKAECVREHSTKRNESIWMLQRLLDYRMDSALRQKHVEWMLQHELGMTAREVNVQLRTLPWVQTPAGTRFLNHKALTKNQRAALARVSFFNTSPSMAADLALLRRLPGNYDEIRALTPAVRTALVEHLDRCVWDFAFPGTLAAYNLTQPLTLESLLSLAPAGANLTSRAGTGAAASARTVRLASVEAQAVALYQRVRWFADQHQHTFLTLAELVRFVNTPIYPATVLAEDAMENVRIDGQLLLDLLDWLVAHKVMHELTIGEMAVYTFQEYMAAWERFFAGWDGVHRRGRIGTIAPLARVQQRADLNAEQAAALEALAVKPAVFIPANPGCGKTYLLTKVQELVGEDEFAVFTNNNCMVDELRARGIKHAFTLRYYIYHVQHARTSEKSRRIVEHLRFFPIVGIDELSNVDLETLSFFYSICCREAVRVVHAYDPHQVLSIGPGQVCIDLPAAFPDLVYPLERNFRIYSAGTGASARAALPPASTSPSPSPSPSPAAPASQMLRNDAAIMGGKGYTVEFTTVETTVSAMDQHASLPLASGRGSADTAHGNDCFRVTPTGRGEADLHWVLNNMLPRHPETGKVDLASMQAVAFHNDTCDAVNAAISRFHDSQEGFSAIHNKDCPHLAPGTRFTLVGSTYQRTKIWPVAGSGRGGAAHGGAGGAGAGAMPGDVQVPAPTKPKSIYSDKIVNRGKYIFTGYRVLNLKTGKWSRKRGKVLTRIPRKSQVGDANVRFVFTKCGKQFAIDHPGCASLGQLAHAWCITIDSYQGGQNDVVIPVLPSAGIFTSAAMQQRLTEQIASYSSPFGSNHLHVAFSRARKYMVTLGTREEVVRLAMRTPPGRQTLFPHMIREHLRLHPTSPPAPAPSCEATDEDMTMDVDALPPITSDYLHKSHPVPISTLHTGDDSITLSASATLDAMVT